MHVRRVGRIILDLSDPPFSDRVQLSVIGAFPSAAVSVACQLDDEASNGARAARKSKSDGVVRDRCGAPSNHRGNPHHQRAAKPLDGLRRLLAIPHFYEEISDDILAGQVPYVDMEVEHLPGSLVPIVLIGVITDIFGLDYELTWTLAMAALFVGSAIIVAAIPAWSESQNRFVLLALPLLPLVVFRLEPWLILFVALAIRYSFLSYWRGGITATAIAALTKGWPISAVHDSLPSQQAEACYHGGDWQRR